MDFVKLFDSAGNPIALGSPDAQEDAVTGIRRTTLAARLKAIYGTVDKVDAFVGMVSEPHVAGTEFGRCSSRSGRSSSRRCATATASSTRTIPS